MSIFKKDKSLNDNNECEKEIRYIMLQKTPWYGWVKLFLGFLLMLILIFVVNKPSDVQIKSSANGYDEIYLNEEFLSSVAYNEKLPKIGYLELNGTIMGTQGSSINISPSIITPESIVPVIKMLAQDDEIKAVVIRLNSPGGEVGASQIIGDYIKLLKAKKPVYVYSDSLIASGGYWISAPATKIYAHRGALVGSIGVISQFINAENLLENKLGLEIKTFKSGKYKDIGDPGRQMTEEEQKLIQDMVDSSYRDFISWVSENRNIEYSEVEKLATGWIFLGTEAQKNKLIDGTMLFEDFIDTLKNDLDITSAVQFVQFQVPKSFFDQLTETAITSANFDMNFLANMKEQLYLPSGLYYLWK